MGKKTEERKITKISTRLKIELGKKGGESHIRHSPLIDEKQGNRAREH
jgi:hypothetical protein